MPAIAHFHSDFLAGGAPGQGEAAPGDHLQSVYRLWLPGHQLEHARYPWRDPYSFRPEADPQLNPAAWPFSIPFYPLWRAFGLVVGWNVLVLLALAGAGLAAFAWLRELGLGPAGALAGGLAFEIAPYRLEQSTGHLLGPTSLLLPLALWAFERGRRGSVWWLALSAAAIASIPMSGQVHLAIAAVPFYAVYAVMRTRERRAIAGAAAGVLLSLGAGILVWRFVVEGSIGEGGRSLRQVTAFSADWLDFLVRHPRHGSESFVFLGWVTLLAAAAGLYLLIRRRTYKLAALLGLGALVPIVLAVGTHTPLYEAVRFVVYPLRYPRVPERLMPVACLAIAALVAFAVDELARARIRYRLRVSQVAAVGAVAAVVLLADLRVTTFEATAADGGNSAYQALRSTTRRLLEVPVFRPGIHYGGVYLYYSTQVRRQRPEGYSTLAPTVADRVAKSLLSLNCGDWTTRPGAVLRRLGVGPIAFHGALFRHNAEVPNTAWFAWRALARHGYRPQAKDGPVTLFARRAGPVPRPPMPEPRKEPILCEGWYKNDGEGRAMSLPHAALWAYGDGGDLRLFLRSERPKPLSIGIDGRRNRRPIVGELRQVRVPLESEGWHLVTFDASLTEVNGRKEGPRIVAYAVG